jgi:hypothetical protein
MKPNENAATSAVVGCPIATAGEVFADGAMIELVGGVHPAHPQVMLWDGSKEIIAPVVEHDGQQYEPAPIESSILQQLTLPTRWCAHGTTRAFLTEICNLVANLVGLDEKAASLVARIVLCSALVDAVSVAPALVIVGPDIARANRLVALLVLALGSADGCDASWVLFASERHAIHVSDQPSNLERQAAKTARRREQPRSENSLPRRSPRFIRCPGDPQRFLSRR